MLNTKIFCFSKPTVGSTVASSRVAHFLADTLNAPLFWDSTVADEPADLLFLVNGAFAFCNCLPAVGAAVEQARRVIWVQQDYTIVPPRPTGTAESPFRKAFVKRAAAGLPGIDYWTTCDAHVAASRVSAYINWNSLTYEPLEEAVRGGLRRKASKDLFYYGAYRVNREDAFDRYFRPMVDDPCVTLSSTNKKFSENYPRAHHAPGMVRTSFFHELASHGLGLYIEDSKSHVEFHSPANRFYEMLSAGLPMVFQPESVDMLAAAGYDVRPYVVRDLKDVAKSMKRREAIGTEQRSAWSRPYKEELTTEVKKAFRRLLKVLQ